MKLIHFVQEGEGREQWFIGISIHKRLNYSYKPPKVQGVWWEININLGFCHVGFYLNTDNYE